MPAESVSVVDIALEIVIPAENIVPLGIDTALLTVTAAVRSPAGRFSLVLTTAL
ncbi:hypothetical protein AGMMS49941_12080 [Deferribacterales bacterium]|nr:hypothetical protein AGMMS49941_12080 [Deferribacterales bacterium]